MKRLSLQWRITLMSVLLIGITCVAMNLLLCSSGVYYMDTIADSLQGGGTVILNDGGAASFDPQLIAPNEELTIVVDGAQGLESASADEIGEDAAEQRYRRRDVPVGGAEAPLHPIDDDGQLLVGRYELRVKACRSVLIQDHRAAVL